LDGATVLSNPGAGNIFVGKYAGASNTTGNSNSAVGMGALYYNDGGFGNSTVGNNALLANIDGNYNSAVGKNALLGNTTGEKNSALGYQAGWSNSTGSGNVFLGNEAGYNETGSDRLYIANGPDNSNTIIYGEFDTGNVGIGTTSPSGKLDVNGDINVDSVYKIGGSTVLSVSGTENTLVGVGAGENNTGPYNTFLGYTAGYSNTTGHSNTFSGYEAGYSNITGVLNTFLGRQAGFSNTEGGGNSAMGSQALYSNTEGGYNSAVGFNALYHNTTGNDNSAVGYRANFYNQEGSRNTIIGYEAGRSIALHNKSGNVFIGYRAGYSETGSNRLYIDNSSTSSPLIYGNFTTNRIGINRVATTNTFEVGGNASKTTAGSWLANSDERIKADIQTVTNALETLDKVRLVSFKYTDDYQAKHPSIEKRRYLNIIAQEFRQVFPEYVKSSGEKLTNGEEILQVDSYPLTIYSAAAVQELHTMAKDKDAEIAGLKERISRIEVVLAKLAREQEGGQR
jgi:hypothetical protein